MKRWYRFFAIMFAFCASLFSVGNASWVINNTNADNTVQAGSPDCTVSFYNAVDTPVQKNTVTENYFQSTTYKYLNWRGKVSYSDSQATYDNAAKNYNTYLGIIGNPVGSGSGKTASEAQSPLEKITYTLDPDGITKHYIVYSFTLLVHWTDAGSILEKSLDLYAYKGYKMTYDETSSVIPESTAFSTSKIKRGSKISQPKLSKTGYILDGFYSDSSCNNTFDFSKPITNDTKIYAKWIVGSSASSGFSTFINNVTQTGDVFLNSSGSNGYAIGKDSSYVSSTRTVFLDACTVRNGATVNFDMNNGLTSNLAGENDTVGEDSLNGPNTLVLSEDNMNYQVVLLGDLIINGNLVIGGTTGSNQNYLGGLIIGSYVQLDLHGHTITINDGGTLHSFGSIIDSLNTGSIIVKAGGTLKTQLVLFGMKGGNSVIWGYSKGISPFENYCLPYIKTKIEIEETDSKSGNLIVFTRMDLGELGIFNFYVPFIGMDSTYFIQISRKTAGKDSRLVITHTQNLALSQSSTYSTLATYGLEQKTNFDFYNSNVVMNLIDCKANIHIDKDVKVPDTEITAHILIDQSFMLSLDRIAFPLSTVFTLNFHASSWTIKQQIMVNVGCVINIDKDSELIFDYYKDSSGKALKKTYPDTTISKTVALLFTVTKTVPGDSKYVSGGLMAIDFPIISEYNYSYYSTAGYFNINNSKYNDYWKTFKKGIVNIFGTVRFTSGNNAPYILSGNINVNKWTIDDGAKQRWDSNHLSVLQGKNVKIQTNSLTVQDGFFIWFNPTVSDMLDRSNAPSYCIASRWVCMFLISNGVSYAVDTSANRYEYGSFDRQSGIFTSSDNKTYVFVTSNNYLLGDYDSQIDYTQTFTECQVSADKKYFSANGKNYIYYGGLTLEILSDKTPDLTASSFVCNANKFSTKDGFTSIKFNWISSNGGYWRCGGWSNV